MNNFSKTGWRYRRPRNRATVNSPQKRGEHNLVPPPGCALTERPMAALGGTGKRGET